MNKLFYKVATLSVGLAMAIGVGVAIGGQKAPVRANAATEPHTVTVNIGTMVDDNGWTRSSGSTVNTKQTSLTLDSHITVSTAGANSNEGSFWGTGTSTDWRLYNGGLTTGYGTFTVTATDATLSSMTVTYTINNGGTLATSAGTNKTKAVTSGTAKSISGTSVTFYVANTGTKTNGQVRVTDISITYATEVADTLNSINLSATSAGTTPLSTATVKTDKTLQVYLTGNYSNSGAVDKTNDATWTATNGTGSATVNKGLITGVTAGTVTISASYADKSAVSLTLTVEQGPKVTLSRSEIGPFHEKETKDDITITTLGFTATPTITASSDSANLTASILQNGNLQIVAANSIVANETATVTVTGTYNTETASATLKVYLKAPVFTLSGSELNLKPSTSSTLTATVNYFKDEVTITASSSATSVFTASVSETTITVNATSTEGSGTLTVTATDGTITRTATATVTVADVLEYSLVTNASNLTEDSQLIIASTVSGSSYAMGEQGENTYRSSVSTTISNNKITGPSSSVKIITLEGESGAWYFRTDEGYLTWVSGNNLTSTQQRNSACTWNITISSNDASIVPSSDQAGTRVIRYNSSSPRFACYIGTQNAVQIYGILAPVKTITAKRVVASQEASITADTLDEDWTITGYSFEVQYDNVQEWIDVTDKATFEFSEDIPSTAGTVTGTLTGTFKSETASLANVTATVTRTPILESISISGSFGKTEFNVGESWTEAKTGLSVIGHYDDETSAEITSGISWSYNPAASVPGVTELTLTATVGEFTATHTEDITVVVPESPYTNGVAYKMYFYNTKTSSNYYFTGTMSGYYGATSTTKSEGVDVKFESNGSGQNLYFMDGSTKNYITVAISGTHINFVYSTTVPSTPWYYNGSYLVYVIDSSVYTLGTYGTNTTFGAYASYQTSNYHVQFELTNTLTAEDFATHMLSDITCNAAGTSRPTGSWSALENLYDELSSAEQAKLQDTTGQSQNIIDAMAKYDYIVGKYGTSVYKDFIGRNPAPIGNSRIAIFGQNGVDQDTTLIVIISSIVGVAAVGGYFFLRRKKEQ